MARRVLIAGGGVAALEAALTLRALVDERIEIELVGPEPHFWYRPLSVAEPFQLGEANHYELSSLAASAGATFTKGALEGVDVVTREAKTSVGAIPYDVLLVAIGAAPVAAVPGAQMFRGSADTDEMRTLLEEAATGEVRRIAFVVPSGASWSLPIYELALMTAAQLRGRQVKGVELVLVTPEEKPLTLFGRAGSDAVRQLLDEREIEIVTFASATEFAHGALQLEHEGRIPCDRVVALPRLRGTRIDGVPQTLDGFVPVDAHGRVGGLEDVYAAGDITIFPVKQGGIATQQADAAAQAIAAQLGADVVPQPFRPVLRGLLLTGGAPRYLRRELAGLGNELASPEPLWWPPAKIVGRHLAPFLASLAGLKSPPEQAQPAGAVEVEVELTDRELDRVGRVAPETLEGEGETVGEAMSGDLLVVAPEDTLGEVAERMCGRDTGSAVVAEYGRLIGILTSRDLLRAFAARIHPSDARARAWMTAHPVTASFSTTIDRAVMLMNAHGIHHLPVVDGERPVGMLGYREAIRRTRGSGIGLGF